MKKIISILVFSLFAISLFAAPSPEAGAEMLVEAVSVFIHALLFLILSLFIMLNVSNPKKKRTNIMTVLLVIFTGSFAFLFFSPDVFLYNLVYLFFIVLDIFFLAVSFLRIKKHKNSGR